MLSSFIFKHNTPNTLWSPVRTARLSLRRCSSWAPLLSWPKLNQESPNQVHPPVIPQFYQISIYLTCSPRRCETELGDYEKKHIHVGLDTRLNHRTIDLRISTNQAIFRIQCHQVKSVSEYWLTVLLLLRQHFVPLLHISCKSEFADSWTIIYTCSSESILY